MRPPSQVERGNLAKAALTKTNGLSWSALARKAMARLAAVSGSPVPGAAKDIVVTVKAERPGEILAVTYFPVENPAELLNFGRIVRKAFSAFAKAHPDIDLVSDDV